MTIILVVALMAAILFNIRLYKQRELNKRYSDRYYKLWEQSREEFDRLSLEWESLNEIESNSVLSAVQRRLTDQTIKGLKKYPNTVKPSDHEFEEWLTHIQEEAIDITVYAEVLRQKKQEELK